MIPLPGKRSENKEDPAIKITHSTYHSQMEGVSKKEIAIAIASDIVFVRAVDLYKKGQPEEALLMLKVAATLNHAQACYHLGNYCMHGELKDPEWLIKNSIAINTLNE